MTPIRRLVISQKNRGFVPQNKKLARPTCFISYKQIRDKQNFGPIVFCTWVHLD